MSRIQTANYTGAPETSFFYATDDTDTFDREDVSFLARALEAHDHSSGKGLSVVRVAPGSIGTTELGAGAVTGPKIAALTIDNSKIAAHTITATQIATGAIGGTEIAAGGVGTSNIAAKAITSSLLGDGAIEVKLGYTPANKGGETFTGNISVLGTINATGTISSSGSVTGLALGAGTGGVATSGQVAGASANITGNTIVGELNGGTTASGSISVRSFVVGVGGGSFAGPVSNTDIIASGSVVASGISRGQTLQATIADGITPPLTIDAAQAGVTVPNLKAALVAGPVDATAGVASLRTLGTGALQAAAGNHSHATSGLQIATGAYAGSGTTATAKTVSGLAFNPLLVVVTGTTGGVVKQAVINGASVNIPVPQGGAATSSILGTLGAGQWSLNALFNNSGESYSWFALG